MNIYIYIYSYRSSYIYGHPKFLSAKTWFFFSKMFSARALRLSHLIFCCLNWNTRIICFSALRKKSGVRVHYQLVIFLREWTTYNSWALWRNCERNWFIFNRWFEPCELLNFFNFQRLFLSVKFFKKLIRVFFVSSAWNDLAFCRCSVWQINFSRS